MSNLNTEEIRKREHIVRHSMAHILAKAVLELYPNTLLTIGPPIDNGFYYDFDIPVTINEDEFEKIAERMQEIINRKEDFAKEIISKEKALDIFKDNKYKLELINEFNTEEEISIYKTGENFIDLCAGEHVKNSIELKSCAFKISSVAGAYWRGNVNNPMLQRIYVFAFTSAKELKDYLKLLEEAKKRDHRKIGTQLDLFFIDETAPGMPYWLPKGWKLFNSLLDFWRTEHQKRGYEEISAPLLNSSVLWQTSGHWSHYQDNMFKIPVSDDLIFALKPMNCPSSMMVYKRKVRSYRELPIRYAETSVIHRKEISGTLSGLFRVQMFRQDDSHNFITEDQIQEEINDILDLGDMLYDVFGLTYRPVLSTRPENFMGDIALWNKAEKELKEVLEKRYGADGYDVNEGDGAFYGPKIDIKMQDALKRIWQTGTIQVDFQLPNNFGLTYTDKDGKQKQPVVIHRALYGSFERFIGILIEHFEGAFPYWLSPMHVGVVPVFETHFEYAKEVYNKLKSSNIKAIVDYADETMGSKIKKFRLSKTPYTIILGDEEVKNNTISLKIRGGGQINNIPLEKFINASNKMIKEHSINLIQEF